MTGHLEITTVAEILNDIRTNTFYKSDLHTIRLISDRIVAEMTELEKDFDREGFLDLVGIDMQVEQPKET